MRNYDLINLFHDQEVFRLISKGEDYEWRDSSAQRWGEKVNITSNSYYYSMRV